MELQLIKQKVITKEKPNKPQKSTDRLTDGMILIGPPSGGYNKMHTFPDAKNIITPYITLLLHGNLSFKFCHGEYLHGSAHRQNDSLSHRYIYAIQVNNSTSDIIILHNRYKYILEPVTT